MLYKKMIRDIASSKVQFISVFILAFLGVFVFSGMRAEWEGMRVQADRYYAQTDLADYFLYAAHFDSDTLEKVRSLPGVKEVQLRTELDVLVDLPDAPTLRLLISGENQISRPLQTQGAAYDPKGDGIWVDEAFAKAHALQINDSLCLFYESQTFWIPIRGFILHPEFVHNVRDSAQIIPDAAVFGYACVPSSALEISSALSYDQMLVALDEAAATEEIATLHANLMAVRGVFYAMPQEEHPSVSVFESEIHQHRTMATLFPILFFLVAALSMLTTMTRLVLAQRTLIATFMGLGFSRIKILFHYLSYGLWIGLIGGFLGLISGPPVMAALLYSFQKVFYSLPVWRHELSLVSVLSALACALICAGSCLLACVRTLREMPAQALRPRAPHFARISLLEKSRLWQRMSFISIWTLRDILRQRVRSAMAVAGILGCTMMLVWGIGIYDSIHRAQEWFFDELNLYSQKVYVKKEFIFSDIFVDETDAQSIDERIISVQINDTRQIFAARIFGDGSLVQFEDAFGKPLILPDEGAIISQKTADNFNLSVGESISFWVLGDEQEHRVRICGIHRTPFEQGFVFSQTAFEKLGLRLSPTAFLLKDSFDLDENTAGVIEIQEKAFLENSFVQMLEGVNTIVWALFTAAVFLGLVVLYNLGSLSFAERSRELATLRVLGYPLSDIKRLLRRQTLLLTAIGAILGIPFGFFFVRLITGTISDSVDFPAVITPFSILICVLGTFLVSFLVDAILSKRTSKIDMVAALKSVE